MMCQAKDVYYDELELHCSIHVSRTMTGRDGIKEKVIDGCMVEVSRPSMEAAQTGTLVSEL